MKWKHFAASAVILVGLLASQAHGQAKVIVGPQQQVNPNDQQWQECSVAGRLADKDEVVVCAQGSDASGMYYAVSFDGGANFEAHTLWSDGKDSGLTVDPVSDRIWISFFGGCSHPEQCVSVAWKDPNDSEFDPFYKAAYITDRPLMAIDPGLGGSFPGRHYLLYSGMGGHHPVWAARSDDPTDPNQPLWTPVRVAPDPNDPNIPASHYHGWGKMPVVLSDGRIAVVNTDYSGVYNDKLPYVVYSDDGGLDWKPDQLPPVKVAEGSAIQAATRPPDVADTPGAIDRRHCAPAIAVDRTVTPNTDVYVAFYARAEPGPLDEDRNTDIYISRSSDRGETFPNPPDHLLQLTDDDLIGEPGGVSWPDQVMPALAIDGCGGVNVVFYDNRHDPNPADDKDWYDLYYVRITDFDTGEPSIYQARLTPESFLVSEAPNFLGDYHHMAVAGPQQRTVYTAYIACPLLQPGGPGSSPEWRNNCYLHQIRIFCLSDLNLDGDSDADDISLFTLAYEGQWELADLNEDGAIDEQDYALFWDVYTNGCGAR